MRSSQSGQSAAWPVAKVTLATSLLLQCLCADRPAVADVFACYKEGVKVFADRPCAPDVQSKRIEIAAPNTYSAPPQPPESRSATPAKRKKPEERDKADDERRHLERCSKLTASLQRVHSKMRAGYKAKEGERLRQRANDLSQDMRRESCS